jgi:hypothetical protein
MTETIVLCRSLGASDKFSYQFSVDSLEQELAASTRGLRPAGPAFELSFGRFADLLRSFANFFEGIQRYDASKHFDRLPFVRPGLPDFSWYNLPQRGKIYQMNIKCSKWSKKLPNSRRLNRLCT